MNATVQCSSEDDLGYDFVACRHTATVSDRVKQKQVRSLDGQERASSQARYRRGTSPTRRSGMHNRRRKRYAV